MAALLPRQNNHGKNTSKVEKILKGSLDLIDPITFSKNSNYGWKSLLEVQRQNIAGQCQQTFEMSTNF